jgi:hypothetical protein
VTQVGFVESIAAVLERPVELVHYDPMLLKEIDPMGQVFGQNLVYDDEITPAMIEGLKKIRGGFSSRGCQFFDMRWNFMPRRFDARYAEAIVIAIANRPASDVVTTGDDYCIEALKSQLANPDVRGKFLKDVYPNLTPPQRAVVDNRDRGQQ